MSIRSPSQGCAQLSRDVSAQADHGEGGLRQQSVVVVSQMVSIGRAWASASVGLARRVSRRSCAACDLSCEHSSASLQPRT